MPYKRIIKKVLDYSLFGIAAIFVVSLIFIPLQYFSRYGKLLITFGFFILVTSLIMDLYYFAKDTPKRKWGKPQKQDTRTILGIKRRWLFTTLEWIGIVILIIILINIKKGTIGNAQCPDTIQGSQEADLRIKYFYSPFCPYCWKEEPILRDMLTSYGNSLSLERYDIRYCKDEVAKYRVSGTPSFVFILKNESKEFPSYGFIPKNKFEAIIKKQIGDTH